jgi:hypothetical protein
MPFMITDVWAYEMHPGRNCLIAPTDEGELETNAFGAASWGGDTAASNVSLAQEEVRGPLSRHEEAEL